LSVAFSCLIVLRQWDLSLAPQPRPSTAKSSSGRRAWSLLRRLIARGVEVLMKDAKENRYLLHSILKNSGIDCGDSADLTPLIAEVARNVRFGVMT
jgi:hypothetical protein